jgi:hypothetical protein
MNLGHINIFLSNMRIINSVQAIYFRNMKIDDKNNICVVKSNKLNIYNID